MAIFALARMEFAELFADLEEAVPKQLIDGKVFLAYQRQLVILGVQEVGCGVRPRRILPPFRPSSNPGCSEPVPV